jgi:hypothetical protein
VNDEAEIRDRRSRSAETRARELDNALTEVCALGIAICLFDELLLYSKLHNTHISIFTCRCTHVLLSVLLSSICASI